VPAVVVTGRHRPHEFTFLVYSALLGFIFLIGARAPGSIDVLMPDGIRWTWYVLLFGSGAVGIASFVVREVYIALTLERAAMVGQVAAFALYALAIFALAGWQGLAAGGLCASWAAASVWRLRQVGQELKLIREATQEDA
jgi:hypothetical protein